MEISSLCTTISISLPTLQNRAFSSSKSSLFFNHSTSFSLRSGLQAQTRPIHSARKKRFCCNNSLFGLGVPELAVIAGVTALIFGPKQIPEIGRSFGKTVKGFQQAAKEFEAELKKTGETKSDDEVIEANAVAGSLDEKDSISVSVSTES